MAKLVQPDKITSAIVLREAGYSLSAIVDKTGVSSATLFREFKKRGISKGGITAATIEEARQQLLDDAGFIADLKHAVAASILDDLSLVKQVRESLTIATEELTNDTTTPAQFKARALAAISTSIKITQEVQRKALAMDSRETEMQIIPELIVRRMTDEAIAAVRDSFRNDDDDLEFEVEMTAE